MYQVMLIEQKMGVKARKVANELQNDFLQRYFGKNKKIQGLAYKALVNNEIDIAKEINKKIALLGDTAAQNIIHTISKKLNEKLHDKKSSSREESQTSKYKKTDVDYFFKILMILIVISLIYCFIYIMFIQ
jgi:hypothetical protein